MNKEEINKLEHNQETINKLFKFINTSLVNDEVVFASYKLALILYQDQYYLEAANILTSKISYFEHQKKNLLYSDILNLLIDIYLALKDKNNSSYYIELKRQTLSIEKEELYYKDLLKHKNTFNEDFISVLNMIDTFNSNKTDLFSYYLKAFKQKISINSDDVSHYYNHLINIDFKEKQLNEINLAYIDYLYETNKKHKLNELLESKYEEYKSYYNTLELIKTNELIKVQFYEAENEHLYYKLPLNKKENLFQALKDFYNEKDKLSYDLYNKKLKDLKLETTNKSVTQKKHVKKYILPKVSKKLKQEIDHLEKEETITQDKNLNILNNIISKATLLKNEVDLFTKVRELLVILEKHLSFSDILLNLSGKVYHYKKERLYEKNYDKHTLDATILGISANEFTDIVETVDKIKYDYDLITNKPLTETKVKQVYCYGLLDYSSICFYQTRAKQLFNDKELFKVVSHFIDYEIRYFNKLKLYNDSHKQVLSYFYNEETINFIYKKTLTGNKLFNDLFKLNKNDDIEILISKFKPNEQRKYIENLQALRRREINSFNVKVTYNNKRYFITNYLNQDYLCGFFTDITNLVLEKEKWEEKAFYDPISKALTLYEFEVSFPNYIKDKNTFILMSLKDLDEIESLYGKRVRYRYFIEFLELAQKHFDVVYQFDQNSLLVVIHKNDIRTIENIVEGFYNALDNFKSSVLDLAKMDCYMGIIRYPILTKEKNIERIYQYLSLTLLEAKRSSKGRQYSYFSFDSYQQELFETEILRQIDRLIVSDSLELMFSQIINLKTNKVYSYQVGVYSSNLSVYEAYYYELAKKRNLINKLEKYIIKQTFIHLKSLFDKTGHYIKVTINVSRETITEHNFKTFLLSLVKTYQIPFNLIEFVYDGSYNQAIVKMLKQLSELGLIIGVNNIDYISYPFIKTFHYTKKLVEIDNKQLNYLKTINNYCLEEEMNFLVYNVNSEKYKKQLQNVGVEFIRGSEVDKTFSFDELTYLIEQMLKNN